MNKKIKKLFDKIPAPVKVLGKKISGVMKRFITKNPVLIMGLSLGPVVAISQSLKAGVSLSVAFGIIIVPVLVIIGFIPVKISKSVRIILYSLLSCIFFIPAFWFAKNIFPEVSDKVGIFLPLMVVNPIISSRSAEAARGRFPLRSFLSGIETAFGFSLVMCIVSAIREILGKGTIWDAPIGNFSGNISFLLPFMGFIIIGFLAAGVSKLTEFIEKAKEEK